MPTRSIQKSLALSQPIVTQHYAKDKILLVSKFIEWNITKGTYNIYTLSLPKKDINITITQLYNQIIHIITAQLSLSCLTVRPIHRVKNHIAQTLLILINMMTQYLHYPNSKFVN